MPGYLSLLSFDKILALPWYVGVPGLLVVAALLLSAAWSILKLQPVKAIIRLILAFGVAIILSQGGEAIARLIGGPGEQSYFGRHETQVSSICATTDASAAPTALVFAASRWMPSSGVVRAMPEVS
jgi:hypothetical protein